jgi:hypothetical protein
MNGSARAASDRQRNKQLAALDAEEAALVKGLLGLDWVREWNSGFDYKLKAALPPYMLTRSLSVEQAAQLMGVILKYKAMGEQVEEEARGILLPEDEAKLQDLRAQVRNKIVQLMPAQEFEEARLRLAALQQLDKLNNLKDLTDAGVSLSPEELREIARIRSAGHEEWDAILPSLSLGNESSPEEKRLWQMETDVKIQQLLGDTRYAKFQAATDDTLKSATQFVQQQNLPPRTAHTLYEIQQAAQDQALEIQDDPALTPSQRRRALQEVRTTTQTALSQVLGERGMENYRQSSGRWLQEPGRHD